jgi:hypothetical protein
VGFSREVAALLTERMRAGTLAPTDAKGKSFSVEANGTVKTLASGEAMVKAAAVATVSKRSVQI